MTGREEAGLQQRQLLQKRFTQNLVGRLGEISDTWQAVDSQLDLLSFEHPFFRQIHSLAGSAGSFGYQRLGEKARKLEQLLSHYLKQTGESQELRRKVAAALEELHELASSGPDVIFSVDDLKSDNKDVIRQLGNHNDFLIYILDDDLDLARELAIQLDLFGYRVEVFDTAEALFTAKLTNTPDAIIIDIVSDEGPLHGIEVARQLKSQPDSDFAMVFISIRDDWEARLAALRAGADAYFSKPVDITLLIEKLERLLDTEPRDPYSVVILEDDVLLAEHYVATLESASIKTIWIAEPEKLLEVLPEHKPDLVLMDLYLENCSGIEAARIIRQQAIYRSMPIIFMSTETALLTQLEALRQGGDDFLQKPISDVQLVEMVGIYAERYRSFKNLMTRDGMTGLLNHINFNLSLKHEIQSAQRRDAPVTVAMLDIDHFKSINDQYGHLIGDRVIKSVAWLMKQRLRTTDIIARYGGEEFAIILPDATIEQGVEMLQGLREQFSGIAFSAKDSTFHATLSAGVVACPPYADPDVIIARADKALYQAKQAGRNRVEMATVSVDD